MKFQREAIATLWDEIMPLLVVHYQQIARHKDIPLNPDCTMYEKAEEAGMFRIYTVRDGDKLIGYAAYFIRVNGHYMDSLQAWEDVLFLDPAYRGKMVGYRFINWCDKQLHQDGVEIVYHHVKMKPELNFGPMLERLGYEAFETIYMRRLNHGGNGVDHQRGSGGVLSGKFDQATDERRLGGRQSSGDDQPGEPCGAGAKAT